MILLHFEALWEFFFFISRITFQTLRSGSQSSGVQEMVLPQAGEGGWAPGCPVDAECSCRVQQGCWPPALPVGPGRGWVGQGLLLGKGRAVMLEQVPRQLLMLQGAKGSGLHMQSDTKHFIKCTVIKYMSPQRPECTFACIWVFLPWNSELVRYGYDPNSSLH